MKFPIFSILGSAGRATALLASLLLASGCASSKSGESEPAQAQDQAAAPDQAEAAQADEAKPEDKTEAKAETKTDEAQAAPQLLAEGTPAPDFTAQAHDGATIQMSKLRGKPVVLYFYPKDETPGCTIEAQSFRDSMADFEETGAMVIGVSLDSIESHKQFADNHELPFPLLADTEGEIAAKYGVDTEAGYAQRVTFLIDAQGTVAKVFPEVDVKTHAGEVLAAVQAL